MRVDYTTIRVADACDSESTAFAARRLISPCNVQTALDRLTVAGDGGSRAPWVPARPLTSAGHILYRRRANRHHALRLKFRANTHLEQEVAVASACVGGHSGVESSHVSERAVSGRSFRPPSSRNRVSGCSSLRVVKVAAEARIRYADVQASG